LVGSGRWTGDARRRRLLGAWSAGAALTLLPFWPLSDFTAFTVARSLAGVRATTLVLPLGDGRLGTAVSRGDRDGPSHFSKSMAAGYQSESQQAVEFGRRP
jgi:hypothetical protein